MTQSEIQSVTFDKTIWTPRMVHTWLVDNHLYPIKPMTLEGRHYRNRITDPHIYDHFTTKKLPGGINLILGWK